jgi:hypothetical protein
MNTYRTFMRSCTNWQQFCSARKRTVDTGLTYEQAQRACREYNANRTATQIKRGTKMEFESE